jgi:hypothetical protein
MRLTDNFDPKLLVVSQRVDAIVEAFTTMESLQKGPPLV